MKKILCLLFALLLLISSTACDHVNENEDENYQEIRNIIDKLDESSFKKDGVNIRLSQKYTIESHTDDDLEKADYTYSYENTGSFKAAYSSEFFGVEGLVDLITSGTGFLSGSQKEVISYDYNGLDKTSNETKREKTDTDSSYEFWMLLNDQECKLSCESNFSNLTDSTNEKDSFDGKISQSLLNDDNIRTSLENVMSKMIIMDGYYILTETDNHIKNVLLNSKELNDDDFSNFVQTNSITISQGEGQIFLGFTIDFSDEVRKTAEIEGDERINVTGKIGFNSETYELEYLGYDLKECLSAIMTGYDEKDDEVTRTVNLEDYFVESEALSVDLNAIQFDNELVEYTDAQEFLNNFIVHALPVENS